MNIPDTEMILGSYLASANNSTFKEEVYWLSPSQQGRKDQ